MAILNIGSDTYHKLYKLTADRVLTALRLAGFRTAQLSVYHSDTEETFVVRLPYPMAEQDLFALSVVLDQDCIAQWNGGDTGKLIGPRASLWGEFNPELFILPDGVRLSQKSAA